MVVEEGEEEQEKGKEREYESRKGNKEELGSGKHSGERRERGEEKAINNTGSTCIGYSTKAITVG